MPVPQLAMRKESVSISVETFNIFIEIDGHGPFIIMTHGLGANSNVFQTLVDVLSSRYTTVRIDWPGHGHSSLSRSDRKVTVASLANIIRGTMAFVGCDKAVLVGHSAGGIASMILAAEEPHRVSALAVMGAGRTRANQPSVRTATLALAQEVRARGITASGFLDSRVAHNIPTSSPALSRVVLRAMTGTTNPEGYAQMCEALCDDSHADPDYSRIRCPTCVIGGVHDTISPLGVTDELVGLIAASGTRPQCYKLNTGHMMTLEDGQGTADAIKQLLQIAGV
ncbi:uncharacterized protein FMAN_16209 [Fusarium mangiferae]|uniref:AB hydrolase-1 domain-containing protein n=1 Tax=Fusarium mangiferae TaxID=192010 RepID=A0A1L7U6A7_FUSMA|nr:uncharacterized protein FMAN_16209 [Fusarium mangiferae]CVL03495.1 uncharacterized protein FMAN_16209 [Fusarium mangiferae]